MAWYGVLRRKQLAVGEQTARHGGESARFGDWMAV